MVQFMNVQLAHALRSPLPRHDEKFMEKLIKQKNVFTTDQGGNGIDYILLEFN